MASLFCDTQFSRQDALHQDALHQDALHQGASHQGASHQDASEQEALKQEASHQDASHQDAVMPADDDEELRVLAALIGCLMVADGDAVEGSTRPGSVAHSLRHRGQGADKAV